LWWLPSSVVCGILFKDINSCSVIWSPSMNSAGRPHFHVPCPACVLFWLSRSGMSTLFVNVCTLFTIVNIAAEEPSVEHVKVVLHTSCTDDWLQPVRACLSHSACWCLNVPLVANLSRMSCNLCALEKACARNHSYTVNREHITFADIIQHSTLTSRFHDTQTLQYTVNLTIDKVQSMKLIKVQPIALGVSFSKDQSSKFEHLFCHVSVKREVRALSFELWNNIWKCHPKWDRLHIFGSIVNHQSTIMIFIFTILLIQTYIQINYYYDKNHADSTVITQNVEIALLNNKSTVLCVFCFYFVLDWSVFQW